MSEDNERVLKIGNGESRWSELPAVAEGQLAEAHEHLRRVMWPHKPSEAAVRGALALANADRVGRSV